MDGGGLLQWHLDGPAPLTPSPFIAVNTLPMTILKTCAGGLLALLLTACGGGYEGPTTPPSTNTGSSLGVAGAPLGRVTLAPVEIRRLAISGGTKPYTAVSQNTGVVLATVSDDMLSLAGVRADAAMVNVIVSDAANNRQVVGVTVTNTVSQGSFTVVPARLSIAPGAQGAVTLQGGAAPFTVVSASPALVTASVTGNVVTVTGWLEGVDAEVRIIDSQGVTRSLPVTVAPPPVSNSGTALFTNVPQLLALPPQSARAYTIAGGAGPYSVISSQPAVVLPSVRGSTLTLQTGIPGTVTVVVTDAAGQQVRHTMTVESSVAPLALSSTAIEGRTNTVSTVFIAGGRPPYRATVDGAGVASVKVLNGNVLELEWLAAGAGVVTVFDADNSAVTLVMEATGLPLPTELTLVPAKVTISERLTLNTAGQPQQTVISLVLYKAEGAVQVFSSAPHLLMPTLLGNIIEVRTPGTATSPRPPCVDAEALVTITVVDSLGQSDSTDIVIRDAGACTG